jgi:selenocysteine-specific elongation factor
LKNIIIGTAGHIDHGKTTLIKALTGRDTDRLKEEKERGISIELGFTYFDLPSGRRAGIIDVPGHEKFIKNMLAGAGGIDVVILVIAADEGVMPQTREHADIIELLGVKKGIVVLTKKDLVDEEWLMLVEEEVRNYVDSGILKGSPIIAVSAVTGEGIQELLETIVSVAATVDEKPVVGQARLPIDRVFTIAGFGTVVTGTLWSGQIHTGESLELLPVRKTVKVRNLHVHNEKMGIAYAGQRVAVNLQGIELSEIKRGYLLATSGFLSPSYRVDTKLRLLSGGTRTLKNWNRIRFHLGTDEALGRVVLLDRDELGPGQEAYAQIVMEKPVVAYKGDPFVIRSYSPVHTIGGGTVIDPNAPHQKRFKESVLNELTIKEEGSLYDVILHEIENSPVELSLGDLVKKTGSQDKQIRDEIEQLLEDELIVDLTGKENGYMGVRNLEMVFEAIATTIEAYLKKYPLRTGYPKEDLRSRLFGQFNPKLFNAILKYFDDKCRITVRTNLVTLPGYRPTPGEKDLKAISQIQTMMEKELFSPPSLEEIKKTLDLTETQLAETIAYIMDKEQLIKINESIYFSKVAIDKGMEILSEYFAGEDELSLATARDLFNTSRKYTLPLIEYYDRIRFTRRVGDSRVRYRPSQENSVGRGESSHPV